jgi:signal transduction histidine kinase
VLTHKGNEADLVQAFRLGAADYLLWPVRETEVLNVVERVLKQVHEHSEREKLSHQLQQANQEMQLRVRELTTIFSIGKAVTSITDQPILFEKILEGATKATQADLGWFSLYDDTRKVFVLVGSRNLPPALGERLNQPWDDGIGSLVAMSGESLSIHGDSLKRFKIMALGQAALIVPVKVQKQVMALLTVIRRKADPFNASEQHLLEAVADYASISLVNARLFRVVEERARAQQILAENAQVGEKIKIEILLNVKDELRSTVEATRYALERMVKDPGARWTAEQRQAMVVMQDSVQNLGRIVEAISPLPLASSQAAGPVDLIDLVNKAVERSRRFAQQNELTLSFEAPLQPVPVLADAIQINQVLDGLLSNAIKFSLPGGHVTVRLEKMADGIAHVTVSDTGIGIDPHFADQIFGGISHPTVPRRFGGLGIRLNLIKEIVTHHKGKVWLESKTGQGAIFHFTLPTPKS